MLMVNNFYDLVTDFYEYGWGQSFHFAPRYKDESFNESLARSEHFLASQLKLAPGMKCLDIGCGIGGPMRQIARFSGANITGVNNNDYQIKRGNKQNVQGGLDKLCDFVKADFMSLPIKDSSYDAAFTIEATCHAPDKVGVFSEILRCLKPGALFAGFEWCMTDKYEPQNPYHRELKFGIEVGNGLPDIASTHDVIDALKKAGFEIVTYHDLHKDVHSPHQIPWYDSLSAKFSFSGFRHTVPGMMMTHAMVTVLEKCRIAPSGTVHVHDMLLKTAKALVRSGELEIFTPDFFFLVRKPSN